MNKTYIIASFLLNIANFVFSNNLQISNVLISGQNGTTHSCMVQFDISWENSWRTNTGAMNWDAAWVFVKFKAGTNGEWQHATLSTDSSDNSYPGISKVDAVSDGKGVFIYRASIGTGNNYFNGISLKWNYGYDGVTDYDTVYVKVIGIEMIYVPQGSFYVGDNNTSTASFKQGSNDNDPWYIGNENAIYVTNVTGSGTGIGQTNNEYYYQASYGPPDEDPSGATFIIPAEFPKGYAAFYCMKYEISMGQYVEFLNMLTRQQQNTRTKTDISTSDITNYYVMCNSNIISGRNTIVCPQTNNGLIQPIVFSTSTPERACNYLNWSDLASILDWSGLRPMTEMEYEKACRGTLTALNGEFAWGNTEICSSAYTIANDGMIDENISNIGFATGNALYNDTKGSLNGPVRCGIFSGSTVNNFRKETGATYYGIMEMSGNVAEFVITVGNTNGRSFTGENGDGVLDASGNSNALNWPGIDASGSGIRGGHWGILSNYLCISDRIGATKIVIGRSSDAGGRGARIAP